MYTSTSSPDLPWLDLNAASRPKNPYGVDFHGTRQWLHLDHLLHSQDLSQCTHLLKLRADANVWSPLNATLFDHVQPGTIYARSDHSFYAEREAFYDVFHDFYHRIFSEFVMASKYKYFEIPEARRAKEPLKHDALGALWLKQPELMFHAGCAKWPGETTCRFGLMANEVVSPQNKSRTTPGTGRGWGNEKFLAVQILQRAQVAAYDLPVHGIFYGKQVRNPPSCRQGTATGSAPKRHLLLWHLQKGGGTQVLAWLRKLKLKVEVSPEHKAPIRRRFRAPSYFRIGLIREPCDYHASEYLWGRRHKLSEAGLGLMRYALEGQGLGYLYETTNVAAGFKTWLKYTHHQLGPEATRSCGVLGARLWTQVVNQTAAATINNAPLNRSTPCVAKGAYWSRKCPKPCPIGDCMFQAPEHLRSACHAEVGAFEDAYPFDCWLRTDRLADDFVECLVKYDSGLGPRLEALMRDRNQSKQVNHMDGRMSCAQMHDHETAELVYRLDGGVGQSQDN